MKKLLWISLGIITLIFMTWCIPKSNTIGTETIEKTSVKNFSTLELNTFLSLQKELDWVIIDVRTPEEIAKWKLTKNALEMDYYANDFSEKLKNLDKATAYFIYCEHGNRSRSTKYMMQEVGFKQVYDLKDGVSNLNLK